MSSSTSAPSVLPSLAPSSSPSTAPSSSSVSTSQTTPLYDTTSSSTLSTSSTPSSSSSSSTPSSTPAATSTTSASSTPVVVTQSQPSSSPAPISFSTDAGAFPSTPSTSLVVPSSTTPTPTPSSTTTQSHSSGFFSNTGAVAGTFTVVGLVSIACVIAVVLFIARRRRHSRSYEEDTEYLDKSPDLSADPPTKQVTSTDDGSTSDHTHHNSSPMTLATPPAAYYPDHAHTLHPQAFSAQGYPLPGSHGYTSSYPVAYTQDYSAQHVYSPEDYDIAYPPPVDPNLHNPHEFTDVKLGSAPVTSTQTALPYSLRPSVQSTPATPKQWTSTRLSVDSFYARITTDPPSPGRAF